MICRGKKGLESGKTIGGFEWREERDQRLEGGKQE